MPSRTLSSDATIVELRMVDFAYRERVVLQAVNLTIGHRQAVSIVGPNGGGKTTLARLILGLLRPQRWHGTSFR